MIMTKKKREQQPKKFEVKKRPAKDKPNFFQNVTPFSHPVAEIFNSPDEETVNRTDSQNKEFNLTSQPNRHKLVSQLNQTNLINSSQIENDYVKTANSPTLEIAPKEIFKGLSKNTYDALHRKTRGATSPVRRIRATKSDLVRWAGVSDVTIDKHIKHLKSVGLLKVDFIIGSREGNWYEVFTLEEVVLLNQANQLNKPNQVNQANQFIITNKIERTNLFGNKNSHGLAEIGLSAIFKEKGSAFAEFTDAMNEFSRKLTMRNLSENEKRTWKELADLLVIELEIAAQADSISNVTEFLTDCLRRRFSQTPDGAASDNQSDKRGNSPD